MSLPDHAADEAAYRAQDRKCADPKSPVTKHIVSRLAAQPPEYQRKFLINSTVWGLGNLVRCALEAQLSPDTADESPKSSPLLYIASSRGHTRVLRVLLAGGANVELANKNGFTALFWAARNGQLSCLQLLLNAGANANAQDFLGNTPLMGAVLH